MATYVFKADSALDAAAASSKNAAAQSAAAATGAAAGAGAAPKKHGNAEREKVQSKLDFAAALSRLGQGHYERAAMAFLKIGPPKGLDGWVGKVWTAYEVSEYGTVWLMRFASYCLRVILQSTERYALWQASREQRSRRVCSTTTCLGCTLSRSRTSGIYSTRT